MRIDPRQPIIWNSDSSRHGPPFWQMDSAGWMREEETHSNTRQVSAKTFLLIAIPVISALLLIGVFGALSVLTR